MGFFRRLFGKEKGGGIISDKSMMNGEEYQLSFMSKDKKEVEAFGKTLEKNNKIFFETAIDDSRRNKIYVVWSRPKKYKKKLLPKSDFQKEQEKKN